MHIAMMLAAALVAPSPPTPTAGADPAALRATVGSWRLSDVGGKVECTLSLTDHMTPAGRDLKAPAACHRAFPPLKAVAAWTLDPQGAIVFNDVARRSVIAFAGAPGGPHQATAPDGKVWRIEPAAARPAPGAPLRMKGVFRLSGPGGQGAAGGCDLALFPDVFGRSGSIRVERCDPNWANRGFWAWKLKQGFLTLLDKSGKPILVLKAGDGGVFAGSDPRAEAKADAITLTRR